MTTTAALPEWVRVTGMIAASALAAAAVLAPTVRGRALGMLGALALTPVLLVAEIWDTPQFHGVRDRPGVAAAGAAVAALAVAALAWLFTRRPGTFGVLALAALPFRVPVESGGTTANLLVPLYLVIGAGALAWLVPRLPARRAGERAPRRGALEAVLLAAAALYALQASYAADPGTALQQVVFFYVPFALLFALLLELEWNARLVAWAGGVLVGLALVLAGVGFVEFATRTLLFNPKVIASNEVESYFRVNSLFFDPNIYGRFLALLMLGLASVLLWARRPRPLIATALALAVLWGGLLLTLSRSSFVALLLGLAVLAWLRWGLRAVLPAAALAAVAGLVLVLAFPGALRLDLGSSASVETATSGRANLISGGLRLAADRPLLGWGSGSFQGEFRRHERASTREATSASHTIPITVAAEQGVVGLLVYVALLALAAARLLAGIRATRGWRLPARAAIAAAFAALVLHTWLYAAFLEDPATWTLLAIGSALAARRGAARVHGGPRAEAEAEPEPALAARS
jgi:O-antigen ligase